MSDLRVALVAEGPTDGVVIEAALRALLPVPFILTVLQPEPTLPRVGGGWCGVLRWCRAFAASGHGVLEQDPTLAGFDLFVIHVDADVAEMAYADCGAPAAADAEADVVALPALPCAKPCPPAEDTANEIRDRLRAWLGGAAPGPKTVLCVPSKATEAWLAAAVLEDGHALLTGLECNLNVEARLASLPKATRIRKSTQEYRAWQAQIRARWHRVRQRCTQADRFSTEVARAVP